MGRSANIVPDDTKLMEKLPAASDCETCHFSLLAVVEQGSDTWFSCLSEVA